MNDIIINNNGDNTEVKIWTTRKKAVKNRMFKAQKIRERKYDYKHWHLGNWHFYISHNIRMKPKRINDMVRDIFHNRDFRKHVILTRIDKGCELCGKEIPMEGAEIHHILPLHRFPQYAMDERNMMCLCHSCHKSLHCNPYRDIALQEKIGRELYDIDVKKEYYEQDKKYDNND